MRRREFLVAGAAPFVAAAPIPNYLLTDQVGIDAAKAKATRHSWAAAALQSVITAAESAAAAPAAIPERGGQWPHWYSCKKDGVTLRTVSPTEHRCPACGTVYRGDPYDAVVLYWVHQRNARAIRDLGLAYRFTGRTALAARARELLSGYAARYGTYRLHNTRDEEKTGGGRIMAQSLDESVWLIPAAFGYALVRETFAPAERERVERDLLAAAAETIRAHRMAIHNIQCWKNSAVGLAGLACGNRDLVNEAIDDPDRGFRAQIARGVTDDGLWYEGSLGYHRYTMEALWPLAEAARLAGIDLFTERYRTLYDAPLALALPDGGSPGFNDSHGGNVLAAAPLYELAFARWKTPAYGCLLARARRESVEGLLYGVPDTPAGPMVPERSVLLGAAGYAVLRSPGTAVAVRFGMHGGGHGHPDKLNIVTFADGHLWGLDPGSINYGVPLHQEWYRSTIAHNTVCVDARPQQNADGRLERWTPDPSAALAASADVYPGVTLRRNITLRRGRLEDVFECRSETEHLYDWAFHAPGALSCSLPMEPQEGPLGDAAGYQHITGVARARTDGSWSAAWSQGGARFTLRMEAAPGTEVFTGSAPGTDPATRVPCVVVRRRGRETTFRAVHEF